MKKIVSLPCCRKFVSRILEDALHLKQIESLSFGVLGAIFGSRLSSATLGRAIAVEQGGVPRHRIKQMDRLFANNKIEWGVCQSKYVQYVIANRKELVISLDWTEFGGDRQSQIAVNLITEHGRATPLLWKTVWDYQLKNQRGRYERAILRALKSMIPAGTRVIVLADRGFASTHFYDYIERVLNWDYVIRMRENTFITTNDGQHFKVRSRVPSNGRIAEFRSVLVTAKELTVNTVVCVKRRKMKEAWSIASSLKESKEKIIALYSRRFTCEEHFRDAKDDRFGIGLKETRVSTPQRRDHMVFINAVAVILLTLLGKAGEMIGCDKLLRANTVCSRTHSLYRQGREYVKGMLHSHFNRLRKELWTLFYGHSRTCDIFAVI